MIRICPSCQARYSLFHLPQDCDLMLRRLELYKKLILQYCLVEKTVHSDTAQIEVQFLQNTLSRIIINRPSESIPGSAEKNRFGSLIFIGSFLVCMVLVFMNSPAKYFFAAWVMAWLYAGIWFKFLDSVFKRWMVADTIRRFDIAEFLKQNARHIKLAVNNVSLRWADFSGGRGFFGVLPADLQKQVKAIAFRQAPNIPGGVLFNFPYENHLRNGLILILVSLFPLSIVSLMWKDCAGNWLHFLSRAVYVMPFLLPELIVGLMELLHHFDSVADRRYCLITPRYFLVRDGIFYTFFVWNNTAELLWLTEKLVSSQAGRDNILSLAVQHARTGIWLRPGVPPEQLPLAEPGYENMVREIFSDYAKITPEVWAKRFGSGIVASSFDAYRYQDQDFTNWIHRLYKILRGGQE